MSDPDCTKDPEYSNTYPDLQSFLEILDENKAYFGEIDISKIPKLEDLNMETKQGFLAEWGKVYRRIFIKTHPDKNKNITEEDKEINKAINNLASSLNERIKCYIEDFSNGNTLGGKKTRRQKKRRQQRRKSSKRS